MTSRVAEDVAARAAALYAEALIWDDHSGFDPQPHAELDNLDLWRAAGVDYLSIDAGYDVMDWRTSLCSVAAYRSWLKARPDRFVMIDRPTDVWRAKREGKLAVTFDLEGMNVLDGDVDMVEVFYDLGVRQMLFAYNRNNLAGGGCHDEDVGLTDFGRSVVKAMNRVGMVVDCSHTAYRTTMEAMELSTDPVIFSHSNAWSLCRHGRNIKDDQIKACAATGGVVGITGIGLFLGNSIASGTFVDHIAYMADLVGPAHVGIALDYAFEVGGIDDLLTAHPDYWPVSEYPGGSVGFVPPSQLPEITATMLTRGFSEVEVRGILGENFLRLASQVWR
ncbi:MAG: membrane dipeptidase [Alphaproteobacteria bacterium]|nr:membrane dipeptidase [Alphaproteobacteria bacterium]